MKAADYRVYARGSKCAGCPRWGRCDVKCKIDAADIKAAMRQAREEPAKMSKAFKVTIDDNRSIVGKAYRGCVMFKLINGACVTQIALTYAAIKSMGQIAEAVKKAEENKKAANAKQRAAKGGEV